MKDKYALAEQAERDVKRLLARVGGFDDLAEFYVMAYTDAELRDLGEAQSRDWVGQYVAGSVDDKRRGLTVIINISRHKTARDMATTLLHELGHAVWELLDEPARRAWTADQRQHKWGPEEAFADDFMEYVGGRAWAMNNETLFRSIAL